MIDFVEKGELTGHPSDEEDEPLTLEECEKIGREI